MKSIAGRAGRIAARICLGLTLAAGAMPAAAASLSDLWFNRAEQGWGVNVIDQARQLFITLFVYGTDGRPTWYVASDVLLVSGTSRFTGPLYATTGPYFGGNFAGTVGLRQVGTVSFTVGSFANTATLAYTVDGVSVTKAVERQSWKSLRPNGTYVGAIDAQTGCTIAGLGTNPDTVAFTVTLSGSNLAIVITGASAGTLTLNATVTQYGSIYYGTGTIRVGTTTYNMAISDFSVDDDGIAGNVNIAAPSGCTLRGIFAGVRPL